MVYISTHQCWRKLRSVCNKIVYHCPVFSVHLDEIYDIWYDTYTMLPTWQKVDKCGDELTGWRRVVIYRLWEIRSNKFDKLTEWIKTNTVNSFSNIIINEINVRKLKVQRTNHWQGLAIDFNCGLTRCFAIDSSKEFTCQT